MWNELRNHLLRNPVYKLTAMITAIFAWVYVQGGEVMDASIQVRVEWELPEQFAPVSPPVEIATAKIRGTRSATRRARRKAPVLQMDASGLGAGSHSIRLLDLTIEDLDPGVQLMDLSPGVVGLELDEMATRNVAVKPVSVGAVPAELEVDLEVVESVIEVRGPRRLVEPLAEIGTQPIDLSALTRSQQVSVGLSLPRQVSLSDTDLGGVVQVRVTVAPSMIERVFTGTRVLYWGDGMAEAEPNVVAVTLRGDAEALEGLSPEDVVVIAHGPAEGLEGEVVVNFTEASGGYLRLLHSSPSPLDLMDAMPATVTLRP